MAVATIFFPVFAPRAYAQKASKKPKVVMMDPQIDDVMAALEAMKLKMFRFDLSQFLNDTYNVGVYLDHYWRADDDSLRHETMLAVELGRNILSLKGKTEEEKAQMRELYKMPRRATEHPHMRSASVYIHDASDTLAFVTVRISDGVTLRLPMKKKPVGPRKEYFYQARPFVFKPQTAGNARVPLVLYGSGWEDKEYDVVRFCGDNEFEPDMSNSLLKLVNDYYVVGLTFRKVVEEGE